MKYKYKTSQEIFWKPKFSDEYNGRNLAVNRLKFIGKN